LDLCGILVVWFSTGAALPGRSSSSLHDALPIYEAQATALFFGREVLLLIGGRDAGDVGLDPDLEEMRAACLIVVVLAVQHAPPGAHALDVAGNDGRAGAHGVLVGKRALEHVADDLHVAVPVGAEARARGDAI